MIDPKPTFFVVLLGLASRGVGEPVLSIEQVCERMRQAEEVPGSFAGTEIVTIKRVGVPEPDLGNYVVAGHELDGMYRWYVRGADWWMVKEVQVPARSGKWSGLNRYIVRRYKDQVLSYEDFQKESGEHYFLSARLDRTEDRAANGPALGRRWNKGSIADMLHAMTDVHQSHSSAGIEIDGFYKGEPLHLTVAPQCGYLTTNLLLHPGDARSGYTITETKKFSGVWMPSKVELCTGDYEDGQMSRGFTGHVEFTNFSPHGKPTTEEVPPIPPGSMLGSEENRLYRFDQDGTLVDFGRQGFKPGKPLAWGDLFVLSGAGLLLTSLSWLVFRKQRTSVGAKGVR